mmetsp:Transcript_35902/g.66741  ORF Transcript_35902/g.66741 Transcript_35902/m.66741 type:complete len:222 (-) Transcript_35902:148-813(-)
MGAVNCNAHSNCTPDDVKPCCTKDNPADAELVEANVEKNPMLEPGKANDANDDKPQEAAAVRALASPQNGLALEHRPPVAFEEPMEPWNCRGIMRSFQVKLEKSANEKFGVEVEVHSDQPKLRVRTVAAGIVEDWNKLNPSSEVLPGHFITKVNGYEGNAMKLIEALQTSASLALTIEVQLDDDTAASNIEAKYAGGGNEAEFPVPMVEGGAALAGRERSI